MKKSILFAAMLAVMSTAQAQKLSYIPWTENALLMGGCVSPNGKYVGGGDQSGRAFIYNTETGEMKFFAHPNLLAGAEDGVYGSRVSSVNDEGLGVGYWSDYAAWFDFSAEEGVDTLKEMSFNTFVSNDGKFISGLSYDSGWSRTPYVIVNGEQQQLPEATEAWIGYETMGFAATGASDDGSVVMGYATDNFSTYPLVLWVRNKDEKTYSLVPVSKRFYDATLDYSGPQGYLMFTGSAISANGRWIVVESVEKTNDFNEVHKAMRYDVLNDVAEEIDCPDADALNWYVSTGISNDGTIVGHIDNQQTSARTAFIVKGGESVAQYMTDVYENVPEIAKMELNGMNTPMAISPDGRYIVGFGYVDFNETSLCFGTYYIDTQAEPDAVKDVAKKDEATAQNKVVATYSLDGKQVNVPTVGNRKGLFIDKMANGRFVKRVR